MKHFDTLQTAFRSFFPLYLKKYACISEKNVFNISLFFFFPRITKNIHRSLQRRTFVNETYVILLVPYTDNIWRVYAWSESVYTSKAVNVHQFSGASSLNQIGLILRRSSFSKFDSFSLCASVHRCVILDTRRKIPRIFLHIDPISIKNFISFRTISTSNIDIESFNLLIRYSFVLSIRLESLSIRI